MNKHIFVSYVISDKQVAERIVSELNRLAIPSWMNQSNISPGDNVLSSIRKALKNSSAVLVLLSSESLHSSWLQFEIGAAQSLNMNIIPVIIEGENTEKYVPESLREFRIIEGRNKSPSTIAQEIRKAIL